MNKSTAKTLYGGVLLGGIILMVFLCVFRIGASIQFNVNCEGRLKRAADAVSLDLAESELDAALQYVEKEDLTVGYTSIIYNTPDEDISFWYNNLRNARDEIHKMRTDGKTRSELEVSNQLMKLRQTLLDHGGDGGEHVTVPSGLSIYPQNTTVFFGFIVSIFAIVAGFLGYDYNKSTIRNKSSSITLIELLVIISILGMIVAIAAVTVT